MRWLKSRLRDNASDGGFTLVEIMVAVFILGIVMAAVQGTLIMAQRTSSANIVRADQSQQGRLSMEAISRNLRTAVLPSQLNGTCTGCDLAAFLKAEPSRVQFYANVNNDSNAVGPSRVTYERKTNGELWETIQPPNAHAPTDYNYQYCTPGTGGCVVNTRRLASGVLATTDLFTYYNKDGVKLGSGAALTAAELASVDSIDVYVSVQSTDKDAVPPTSFTTRVSLPNADAVPQPSTSP